MISVVAKISNIINYHYKTSKHFSHCFFHFLFYSRPFHCPFHCPFPRPFHCSFSRPFHCSFSCPFHRPFSRSFHYPFSHPFHRPFSHSFHCPFSRPFHLHLIYKLYLHLYSYPHCLVPHYHLLCYYFPRYRYYLRYFLNFLALLKQKYCLSWLCIYGILSQAMSKKFDRSHL